MMNNVEVKILREVRNLGLLCDANMSFLSHSEHLSRNCSQLLYNIITMRPFISQKIAFLLVESFVISRIRLYSVITGTSNKSLENFPKGKNYELRIVRNLRKYDHISHLCECSSWGNIDRLSHDSFKGIINKVLQNRSSVYSTNQIQRTSHNRTKRQLYSDDRYNSNEGQRRFKHRAAIILN